MPRPNFTSCEVCGGQFSRSSLEIHKKKCSEVAIPCSNCGLLFRGEKEKYHWTMCGRINKPNCETTVNTQTPFLVRKPQTAASPAIDDRKKPIEIPEVKLELKSSCKANSKHPTKKWRSQMSENNWRGSKSARFKNVGYDPICGLLSGNFAVGNQKSFAMNI